MIKYRRLTDEELEEMRDEFIQFLVANGIDAKDWEKMKGKHEKEADSWINAFSTTVLQKILEKIEYLEHRTPTHLKLFRCAKEAMELIALSSQNFDFTVVNELPRDLSGIEICKAQKKYNSDRELELFQMTEQGCKVVDGNLFLELVKTRQ